jgi:hypothetical protein
MLVEQPDRTTVLQDRLPAVESLKPFEQHPDAALPFVGDRPIVRRVEGHLLVLGAETPIFARLLAGGDPLDQFRAIADGSCIGNIASHALPRRKMGRLVPPLGKWRVDRRDAAKPQ